MTITEPARHQLYEALVTALGEHEATTLMEHLPPVGWADVATKTDLDHLGTVIEARFDTKVAELRTEIAGVRTDVANQFRMAQRSQLAALVSVATVIVAILGLLITLT